MEDETEAEFHRRRAAQERAAAAATTCMARTAHIEIAEEHEAALARAAEDAGEVQEG